MFCFQIFKNFLFRTYFLSSYYVIFYLIFFFSKSSYIYKLKIFSRLILKWSKYHSFFFNYTFSLWFFYLQYFSFNFVIFQNFPLYFSSKSLNIHLSLNSTFKRHVCLCFFVSFGKVALLKIQSRLIPILSDARVYKHLDFQIKIFVINVIFLSTSTHTYSNSPPRRIHSIPF